MSKSGLTENSQLLTQNARAAQPHPSSVDNKGAALVSLDGRTFHCGTPVGIAELPEGTYLERVAGSRSEVIDRGRRLGGGCQYRRPINSGARRAGTGA